MARTGHKISGAEEMTRENNKEVIMKHTKTPWKLRPQHIQTVIVDKNDNVICETFISSEVPCVENAEHIVHCVNNYESLKASHKELREAANDVLDYVKEKPKSLIDLKKH